MKVYYKTFARFVEFFGKEGDIELPGDSSVLDALNSLCSSDEKKRSLLFDENGLVRRYVIILKDNERLDNDTISKTSLQDGDGITIYPPVSGG
jgi:sulfur-carrier protein